MHAMPPMRASKDLYVLWMCLQEFQEGSSAFKTQLPAFIFQGQKRTSGWRLGDLFRQQAPQEASSGTAPPLEVEMAEQGPAGIGRGTVVEGASGPACEWGEPKVSKQAGHDSGHLLLSASEYSRAANRPGETPPSLSLIFAASLLCSAVVRPCFWCHW